MDRHTEGLRERERVPEFCLCGSLNYFCGVFLLDFLWPFWFMWFTVCIWYISQDPPMCVHIPLSQDGFCCKGLWVEHPLTSLLDLQGAFLCMCGREVFWLGKWEIWDLGRTQPPPCIVLLFSSWSFCPQGKDLQSLYPGEGCISVLPCLHSQPSSPIQSGVYMLVVSLHFTSSTWVRGWVWHLQNQSRTWLRILSMALKEELKVLDFVSWLSYYSCIFLDCFPLFLLFLTSEFALWNLGGRPRRLQSLSKQEAGDLGRFVPRKALQGPAQFHFRVSKDASLVMALSHYPYSNLIPDSTQKSLLWVSGGKETL